MANEAWRAGTARCPHYVRSNARTITCSPSGEEDDEIRRRLKSSEACAEWFRQYCARQYSKCFCYEIIDRVLEGETDSSIPLRSTQNDRAAGVRGPYGITDPSASAAPSLRMTRTGGGRK